MMYLYIVHGVLLLTLGVLVTVPIKVIADYADGSYQINIKVFGISMDVEKLGKRFSKKHKKPVEAEKPQSEDEQDAALIDKINGACKLVRRIRNVYNDSRHFVSKHFYADNIYVNISFGTWDAALTGIATGAVWALLYDILGLITTVATVNNHKFDVDSVYDRCFFDIKAGAVFKFRIAGIAGIALCVLYNLKKYKE